ncbi:hypothetical protein H4S06_006359, partial [Coemansia sp. BCRC 34490]
MLSNISIKIDSMLVLLAAAAVVTAQPGWVGYENAQAVANMPMAQPYMRGKMLAAAGGKYEAYESVEPSSETTEEYSTPIYSAESYTSEEVEPSSEVPEPTYPVYQGVEPSETQTCPYVEPSTVTVTDTETVTHPAPPAVTVTSIATVTVTDRYTSTVTVNDTVTVTSTVTKEVAPTYETKPAYEAPKPSYEAPKP